MSSSDLELARALSRLLSEPPSGPRPAGPAPRRESVAPTGPSRFLRFRKPPSPVPEAAPVAVETGGPASAPPVPED